MRSRIERGYGKKKWRQKDVEAETKIEERSFGE
jgi:hypothetical protein